MGKAPLMSLLNPRAWQVLGTHLSKKCASTVINAHGKPKYLNGLDTFNELFKTYPKMQEQLKPGPVLMTENKKSYLKEVIPIQRYQC